MKPPAFGYIVATDSDTAVAALVAAGGEAKILAGGQSLMPMLNFRLLRPSILVDINRTELLTEIVLPQLPARTGWGFEEIVRRHGDFALAAAGATLTLSGNEIVQARIAVTGVGPTTLRAAEAESLLVGREFDENLN